MNSERAITFIIFLFFCLLFTNLGVAQYYQEDTTTAGAAEVGEAQTEVEADSVIIDSVQAVPPPLPPTNFEAYDAPNDRGGAIDLTWDLSPDDSELSGYIIYRSEDGTNYQPLAQVGKGIDYIQDSAVKNKKTYYYKIAAVEGEDNLSPETAIQQAKAKGQWYNTAKTNILLAMLLFFILFFWYTYSAQSGKEIFIRKIPGLSAIGEAVGRATEMGRPVLYVPGIGALQQIQTLASLVILGEVAKVTAEYDTPIIVPTRDPIVYTAAEEIVKESYMDVGRPDAFNQDNIRFLTSQQFAYVAGVNGIMLREKPAANLYMGVFYAESLMLAETGFEAGAIQVAGTAMVSQIPFFIAACDYTLIGEELYAASAYLSKDPKLLVGLKVSDIGKILFAVITIIGVITITLGKTGFADLFLVR
jgi:hypothetical protein